MLSDPGLSRIPDPGSRIPSPGETHRGTENYFISHRAQGRPRRPRSTSITKTTKRSKTPRRRLRRQHEVHQDSHSEACDAGLLRRPTGVVQTHTRAASAQEKLACVFGPHPSAPRASHTFVPFVTVAPATLVVNPLRVRRDRREATF